MEQRDPSAIQPESGESKSTRERLLAAALHEFAIHGYAGASLRRMTERAGVALGNVRHIFGGKHQLLGAVHAWVFEPVTASRLALLDALLRHRPNPSVVEIFDASAEPVVEAFTHEAGHLRGMFALRGVIEHDVFWPFVKPTTQEVSKRYLDACTRSLSDLPAEEVASRWGTATLTFALGLTPGFQNVDEPRVSSEEEILRCRRHALAILTAPPVEECDLPAPAWSRSRAHDSA